MKLLYNYMDDKLKVIRKNAVIYNLSFGLHIARFSVAVAKKRKIFE